MNPEDEEAKRIRALLVPPPLDQLGVAELSGYIRLLEAEIARVMTAIAAKDAHRSAAAAFFRMGPPADDGA